ncbi:hypothetical protein CORC01_06817 [Colletotrichum orchidophilum]|uniref:Transcription factor RfeG n=1 Tax=Colletotrichum orchidophilum TaxID=1209926 RepID=A0A1G4B957_9PEZI|nr:uncharacterized protein CORC01_06817 [Colletotrichum orchidophilum]OHE97954.1 hypothetical protein CORC01_06817 [Colletotrichum orchidophilum]
MSSSIEMNRYWIPRLDIHKKIITQELPYYLGPDATVRPYTNEGEDGFLITTPGRCLTDEQIDDICRKSKDVWERQAAIRAQEADKPLKRPLHQPVVISQGSNDSSRGRHDAHRSHEQHRRNDNRRRE